MISFGSSSGSNVSKPSWLMGKKYAQGLGSQWGGMFSPIAFDPSQMLNNPTSAAMYNLAKSAATQQSQQGMEQAMSQKGLSQPALAELMKTYGTQATTAAAGVPAQVWQQAMNAIQLLMAPAGQYATGSTSGLNLGIGK